MNALEIIRRLRMAKPAFVSRSFRLTGALALAALALCCLPASFGLAAEEERLPAVTVGDFTFTPPAILQEGDTLSYPLAEGVSENASVRYLVANSGRCMQVISARSQEKNAVAALKKIVNMTITPDMVYSLGDGLGVGIKNDPFTRSWGMLTRDGHFFFICLFHPYPDLKGLADALKTDQPGAEIILTALKSPQVQSWLNFAVLGPNERMSSDRAVYAVPEGWTYEEKDGEVRIVSKSGRQSLVMRVLEGMKDFSDCIDAAEAAVEAENGPKLVIDYDGWSFWKDEHTRVIYECVPRPLYRLIIRTNLDKSRNN